MSKKNVQELEEQIKRHNYAYFVLNSPEISDSEFDRLIEELKKLKPDSPVLSELGSDLTPGHKRIKHARPMLSLDKCYQKSDLAKWFEKIKGHSLAMPKIDGVACSIHYDSSGQLVLAATRGDGKEGEDITQNILEIKGIPKRLEIKPSPGLEIRGEVYLSLSRFNKHYAGQFANPRNLAAGALKQKDPAKSAAYGLSFFAYDIDGTNLETEQEKFDYLERLGFAPMPIELADSIDSCEQIFKNYEKKRPGLDYEIDGVVFRANQVSEQSRLGLTAHHPKWAIAYKFQGDSAHTQLINVKWSLGRTGIITPVALVKPVVVSGATVKRASLHNLTLFQNLELCPGATVEIVRRGGVIPYVERVLESKGEVLRHPNSCPSCHKATLIDGEFLHCPEPEHCPDIISSRLIHFASVLELEGFGEKLIKSLIKSNLVKQPADLYTLQFEELIQLDRMGEVLARKLLGQINQKRSVSLPVFLTALGFDELGPTIAENLSSHFETLQALQEASLEDLKAIHGIGYSIAESVLEGFKAFESEIEALLQVIKITDQENLTLDKNHPLFGKSVVFTGTLESLDRKEAQKKVRALGGQTPSSISAATDYLVIGGNKPSSKRKKAEQLGVEILSEKDFLKLVSGLSV